MGNTRMNGGFSAVVGYLDSESQAGSGAGGRYWTNYTWHGDQDPSQPWWSGTQNSDVDLTDMRFSKLNTSWGKNFVENKMPEAHWKLECIERGARVVVITPGIQSDGLSGRLLDARSAGNRMASLFLGA